MRTISIIIIFFLTISTHFGQSKTYDLNKKKDGITLGIGVTLNLLGYGLLNNQKNATAESLNSLSRDDIWKLDRSATRQYSLLADERSDYLLLGTMAVPLFALFDKKIRSEKFDIALLGIESLLITNGITNITKATSKRFRPYSYNPNISIEEKISNKRIRRSFFSGHTSVAATVSFFSAKVWIDTHPNMKNKWIIWTLATAAPISVGYFRYKAGSHFPTDVFTGIVVGGAVGYFVPQLHLKDNVDFSFRGNGVGVVWKMR